MFSSFQSGFAQNSLEERSKNDFRKIVDEQSMTDNEEIKDRSEKTNCNCFF